MKSTVNLSAFASRFALVLYLLCGVVLAKEDLPQGIVASPPEDGRYVQCEAGYMVPYTESIPGTEATFEMVPIPGGVCLMGSPVEEADRSEDEGPQVTIRIEPFWMGQYEVTWTEYREFMRLYDLFKELQSKSVRTVTEENEADAVTIPTPLYDPSFAFALGEGPRQPAVTMTQYAAKQYTKWVSGVTGRMYRLPTEAEWEYACRAGTKTAFSYGDDTDRLGDYAWYFDNSDDLTHDVGQKLPNPWGLYDIHGNVAELVLDQYVADRYESLPPGELAARDAIAWPTKDLQRVIRGGSWEADGERLRSAARAATDDWRIEDPNLPKSPWWFTDEEALSVGFRVVRPLNPPPAPERNRFWKADVERLIFAIENRMAEGRGVQGLVDPDLPADLEKLKE